MNLQKLTLSVLVLLVALQGIAQSRTVEISGNIAGLEGRKVEIYKGKNFTRPVSTTNGKGDNFKMTVEVDEDESTPYYLNIPSIEEPDSDSEGTSLLLYLDGSSLWIDGAIVDQMIELKSVRGSAFMDDIERLKRENEYSLLLKNALDSLDIIRDQLRDDNEEEIIAALEKSDSLIHALEKNLNNAFLKMTSKYSKSKALASILIQYCEDEPLERKKAIMSSFDTTVRSSYWFRLLEESIRKAEKSAIGMAFPDFNMYTADGKVDKISNYRGKYLLIDFWASWCGPCLAGLPNLSSIYNDYKDKGLKVIGISVDQSKEDWLKCLEKEKLAYDQFLDKEDLSGDLLDYRFIPFVILVSPEGIILERQLYGDHIRKKVKEYLESSSISI